MLSFGDSLQRAKVVEKRKRRLIEDILKGKCFSFRTWKKIEAAAQFLEAGNFNTQFSNQRAHATPMLVRGREQIGNAP